MKVELGHGCVKEFGSEELLGWFKSICYFKNFRVERSYLGVRMVIKISFLRAHMVKFPIDQVGVRHEWRSSCNTVELQIVDISLCWLVTGDSRKIIVVKNSINSRPVHVEGF